MLLWARNSMAGLVRKNLAEPQTEQGLACLSKNKTFMNSCPGPYLFIYYI